MLYKLHFQYPYNQFFKLLNIFLSDTHLKLYINQNLLFFSITYYSSWLSPKGDKRTADRCNDNDSTNTK